MSFLKMKEVQTGIVFNNPVLDTLLLSAVVHPTQELHSLDSIADRLELEIDGRHGGGIKTHRELCRVEGIDSPVR